MRLTRRDPPDSPISLVPMIDVLMILLVFFMVTSTYFNLTMVPMAGRGPDAVAPSTEVAAPSTVLVRLAADGSLRHQGRPVDAPALAREVARRLADEPGLTVMILPSGQATTQALVSVMDAMALAGVTRLRLLRVEAAP